jgi:hypothetical protein
MFLKSLRGLSHSERLSANQEAREFGLCQLTESVGLVSVISEGSPKGVCEVSHDRVAKSGMPQI